MWASLESVLHSTPSMFRAFASRPTLPMCEVEREHIQARHRRIRPFNRRTGFKGAPAGFTAEELVLSAWRLAHAVRKADCLLPSLRSSPLAVLGFLLEHLATFDWRQPNLRLHRDVARGYSDSTGTSFAGRIGAGVALLSMESRGYAFAAHYERRRDETGPDFIVQGAGGQALVEAKGSFVIPGAQPDIKALLREALEQLDAADPQRTRGATKSFAVGTLLREVDDEHPEPSLVAIVDPEVDDSGFDGPPDWVVRENYAGWFRAMGLHDVASDLRGHIPRESGEGVLLWPKTLAGSDFLLMPLDWPVLGMGELDYWPLRSRWLRDQHCVVLGLKRAVVESLQSALRDPSSSLVEGQGSDSVRGSVPELTQSEGFYGSVMNDGSLMGTIRVEALLRNGAPEEIEL
jgi:hypothetical protein